MTKLNVGVLMRQQQVAWAIFAPLPEPALVVALRLKAIRRYFIGKMTTPSRSKGRCGALPISAGTSFHGRRKPNGSACQRRTMAAVQEEAKHAISAMSPLKSCDVEKPQPQR
jgi:hypothetical protein